MYPLGERRVLTWVVTRVAAANAVDTVVVATSVESPDDVVVEWARRAGAEVVRGEEQDVLSRFGTAVAEYPAEAILRVTGDCPLVSPEFIDTAVDRLDDGDTEYASAALDRTFPRGVTCEAFTRESFERVVARSEQPHHREHVTPYYRERPEEFVLENVTSVDVFDETELHDRTDLRLTLDEPDDYELLCHLYEELSYDDFPNVSDAMRYVDENDLATLNTDVEQRSV